MIESPYPLERGLGMELYSTDSLGTGGVLRKTAEDFLVEEISSPVDGEGPYLICRLTKKNWELQRLVKEIARSLGISHRRIGWAGTKDKHAVTIQWISIFNVDAEAIEAVHIRDVSLEVVGRSSQPLSLGMLQGNIFSLWIRDCPSEDLTEPVEACVEEVRKGILNYYGIQRFGARRPVTHLVGESILRGNFEEAIRIYVGRAFPDEPKEIQLARQTYLETGDPRRALHEFPTYLSYERAILHTLQEKPGRYWEALSVLPPKLLSMLVSAFQSYLFNAAVSDRGHADSIHIPIPGDMLLFTDGKVDQVTESLLPAARIQVARSRAVPALFIPGSRIEDWAKASPRVTELLKEHGITPSHFQQVQNVLGTSFQGFIRPICLSTRITSRIQTHDVYVQFTLPPGQYATTVCREFMKNDPLCLV